jgi:hypothetical protein
MRYESRNGENPGNVSCQAKWVTTSGLHHNAGCEEPHLHAPTQVLADCMDTLDRGFGLCTKQRRKTPPAGMRMPIIHYAQLSEKAFIDNYDGHACSAEMTLSGSLPQAQPQHGHALAQQRLQSKAVPQGAAIAGKHLSLK